ncbi:MAG: hypothetical protein IKR48_05300 [Kiritimatiellae bacterium]|nr:hypothetical protein [Kiritimatiellia bacterium]
MKKTFLFLLAFLCLTGCASIQVCRDFKGVAIEGEQHPIATIAAENYGYYLFGFIPLITGNPNQPERNDCFWFRDTVTVQNNMRMVANAARREHGDALANVKTTTSFDGSFSFWIVFRKIIFTSAVVTGTGQPKGNER